MKPNVLFHLPFSTSNGWSEIERIHPKLLKLFAFVVLPLSLLPPLMVYYAGTHYPEAFLAQGAGKDWAAVAAAFFLTEVFTLVVMGWLIKQVANSDGLRIDYHDAYLLASISPIPLWLSSLALFVPSLAFNAVVSLAALGLSCGIIYHGLESLGHTREDMLAANVVQTVIGIGLIAWALMLVLVIML